MLISRDLIYFTTRATIDLSDYEPLETPLRVVKFNEYHYVTTDNYELLFLCNEARKEGSSYILCSVVEPDTYLDESSTVTGAYDYHLAWFNPSAPHLGYGYMQCTPRTYKALVAIDCAAEGLEDTLTGTLDIPCISYQRSHYVKCGSRAPHQCITNEEVQYDTLESVLQDPACILCFSTAEAGQMFTHRAIKEFLKNNTRKYLDIILYEHYPHRRLKHAMEIDEDDVRLDDGAREFR